LAGLETSLVKIINPSLSRLMMTEMAIDLPVTEMSVVVRAEAVTEMSAVVAVTEMSAVVAVTGMTVAERVETSGMTVAVDVD
jgi:hypothetical protein